MSRQPICCWTRGIWDSCDLDDRKFLVFTNNGRLVVLAGSLPAEHDHRPSLSPGPSSTALQSNSVARRFAHLPGHSKHPPPASGQFDFALRLASRSANQPGQPILPIATWATWPPSPWIMGRSLRSCCSSTRKPIGACNGNAPPTQLHVPTCGIIRARRRICWAWAISKRTMPLTCTTSNGTRFTA